MNKVLPDAKIMILTNGSYLFQEELNRFESLKIWRIIVSVYNKKEYYRLRSMETNIPYHVFIQPLMTEKAYTQESLLI
ncbi:MAG: hypothetical protein GY816_13230 [Cytophagales bacterium]|nr:hypothetical protein [Cytophagales bacterium]